MSQVDRDEQLHDQPEPQPAPDEKPPRASIWSWPDAAPGARAAAFVLDCLILTAIWGLLQVFCDRFLSSLATEFVQSLSIIAYWIGLQLRGGRTIGQRATGLRLIALDAQDLDEGISLLRLTMREFVYFPLSVFGLGMGVLMIVFRKDRMALHDLLSRTRVVTLSLEPSSEPVRLSAVLSVMAGITTVVVLGFSGVMYWTPYPLRSPVHALELLGYRFGRITGSLSNGFRIEQVAFENDELALELHDIRFRYQGGDAGSLIENLTVEKADISFRKMPDGFQWPSVSLRLLIDSADVKNVTLQLPSRQALYLKRIFLSDVGLDQRQGAISMGRIWIDSEAMAADIQDFVVQDRAMGTAKPSHLTFKTGFDSDVIAAPIDVTFEGFYQDGVFEKFSLEAFKGRVKAQLNGRAGDLVLRDFTPAHFLHTEIPLWNLNLTAHLDFLHGKIGEIQGSVDLRNHRFTSEGASLVHQRGAWRYALDARVPEAWLSALEGREPMATLRAGNLPSVPAILADIYFQRPLADLSTSEHEMVAHDRKYFLLAPAEDEPLASPRAPTSEKH